MVREWKNIAIHELVHQQLFQNMFGKCDEFSPPVAENRILFILLANTKIVKNRPLPLKSPL